MIARIFQCLPAALLAALLAGCQSTERKTVAESFPIYRNSGKPDLTIDRDRLAARMEIVDQYFSPGSCPVQEGAVGTAGMRRILRFDTVVLNSGDGDLVVGDRADPRNAYAQWFVYAPCHRHYHIRDFSAYDLLRAGDEAVVVAGRKQGFCFEDSLQYGGARSKGYMCSNQGISSGWADLYGRQLTGQWLDITGVPEGDYLLRVTINAAGTFDEGLNRYPNTAQVPIHIPDPHQRQESPLASRP